MKTNSNTNPMLRALGILTFTTFSFGAFAQEPIIVTMDALAPSTATRNSYSVDIPQVSLKDVERDWVKEVGKSSKGKATVVNGEHVQSGAVNTNISPEPFTYYSRFVEAPKGVRLTSWLGNNNIVSASGVANANQDLAVQKFMRDFAVEAYRGAVKEELKMEEDKLRDLEKNMAQAVKTEEKSNKTIQQNQRSNIKADDAIATNERDIERKTENITDQKDMVQQTAADPNANKGAKKTLGELESDKKGLQKENEKASKDIVAREKESRAADRTMVNANQVKETKASDIEAQREVVRLVKLKLDGIK
ncbi:MAG: hypothetical protein KBF73_08830 [Flavobacteriales bacterium]|nr:hypothetical protein [Flavobacteriales bacterium]